MVVGAIAGNISTDATDSSGNIFAYAMRGLFCTRNGEGYLNEDSGQATGWDSMWQRFMTRLLKETDIEERFTEHDLRGKVGSDLATIERASDLLGHASKEITKRNYRRKPEVIKPVR